MEFLALTEELVKWIDDLLIEANHWILAWEIKPNKYSLVHHNNKTSLLEFLKINLDNVHLFIGNKEFRSEPIMITKKDGEKRIDFKNSLCIQLVPSFIRGGILVKGHLNTFPPREYKNIPEEKQFMSWKNKIYRSFKIHISDPSFVITQILNDGTVKEWKNHIISAGAVKWHEEGGELKAFLEGPVKFVPKKLEDFS